MGDNLEHGHAECVYRIASGDALLALDGSPGEVSRADTGGRGAGMRKRVVLPLEIQCRLSNLPEPIIVTCSGCSVLVSCRAPWHTKGRR